jgi:hypothetical protein
MAAPPLKPLPWQIWQEKKLELPGALFAAAPCTAGSDQFVTAELWWHAMFRQLTREIPPSRASPWHSVQLAVPSFIWLKVAVREWSDGPGKAASQPAGCPPCESTRFNPEFSFPDEHPMTATPARRDRKIGRNR